MKSFEIYTHCNKCPHKVTATSSSGINWYCGKCADEYTTTKNKNIKYFVKNGDLVPTPAWCPLKKESGKYSAFATKSKEDDYKPKESTYVSPYLEKLKIWNSLPHMSNWDSIEVNELYHVPPVNGEPRMDIIITHKSEYNIGYKTITKDNKALTTYASFYKSSPQVNFLVKHKLIKVENK